MIFFRNGIRRYKRKTPMNLRVRGIAKPDSTPKFASTRSPSGADKLA